MSLHPEDFNPPAFPVVGSARDNQFNGMSLRDYFAAKAMQGLLADGQVQGTPEEFAFRAYSLANAMLAERAKAEGGAL